MPTKFSSAVILAALAMLTKESNAIKLEHDEAGPELGVCECLADNGLPGIDGKIIVEFEGIPYEYDSDIGTGSCAAWDSGQEPYCADNEAHFCTAMWCYVSSDCTASDTTIANDNPDISYSYATCGDSGDFPNNDEVAAEADADAAADGEEAAADGAADAAADGADAAADPGSELGVCECLADNGFTPIDGQITVELDGIPYQYPADTGIRCAAWDSGQEPYCADNEAHFCTQMWCAVSDDCAASDTTHALGLDYSYSYATCGDSGTDYDNTVELHNPDADAAADPGPELGVCECLADNGFHPIDGKVIVDIGGTIFEYDADAGTRCATWDFGLEPFCVDNEAHFCTQMWCFVSNDCAASDTTILNGLDIAYSYATCGDSGEDFENNVEIHEADADAAADGEEAVADSAADAAADGEEAAGEDAAAEGEGAAAESSEGGSSGCSNGQQAVTQKDHNGNNVSICINFIVNVTKAPAPAAAACANDCAADAGAAGAVGADTEADALADAAAADAAAAAAGGDGTADTDGAAVDPAGDPTVDDGTLIDDIIGGF